MSPEVLYSPIPIIRPAVPRVDASATLKLRKGAPRKDLDGESFMAYETKVACATTTTDGKIIHHSALRVYIYGIAEDQPKWADGTIISASGYLTFGLRGRDMSLHLHQLNITIWPTGATDPPGLGTVRCSFMGLIGKHNMKEEDSGVVVRWDVELFQAGEHFLVTYVLGVLSLGYTDPPPCRVYVAGLGKSEAKAIAANFKSRMLGQFATQLSQLGFGSATNRPVFAATSMQAVPHRPDTELKSRSLSPTPPPESTTLKRRAAGSLEANESEAKKTRTEAEAPQQGPSQQGPSQPSTSRYHESRGGGRTAVLPIHDADKKDMS